MFGSTALASAPNPKQGSPTTVVASGPPAIVNSAPNNNLLGVQKVKSIASSGKTSIVSLPNIKPLVDSANFSRLSAQGIISLFILILILDMVIIERKKLIRFVGHNLDHVLFLSVILLIIIILVRGAII